MIHFPRPLRLPFQNALNGKTYYLARGDQIEPSAERLQQIARCCNEALLYDRLFRARLQGAPYLETHAAEWVTWTHQGWRDHTHFSFVVVDESRAVAAACDIKSAEVDGAEVGYWASEHHRGIMTNAVTLMCQQARKSGFQGLTARVIKGNSRSSGVLYRVGFHPNPTIEDEAYEHYLLDLAGWQMQVAPDTCAPLC